MSIEEDVKAIATPHGREVGTPGHNHAKEYIVHRLRVIGVVPYLSEGLKCEYDHGGTRFCNVIGIVPGIDGSASPILLGAHYDTCGRFPGADDNAAAVAVLLNVAEQITHQPLKRSVVFAFFDAEEPPYFLTESMGSIRFYEDQKRTDFHCGIIMDLVGHDVPVPGLEDVLFIMGMESDQGLGDAISSCPIPPTLRMLPTLSRYVGDMSEHHIFRQEQVPYLFLSCGMWTHYHQATDTPERLNYVKIEAISKYLAMLTSAVSANQLSGPFEGYDSTSIEIGYIERVLYPVMTQIGLPIQVKGRRDIDQLVDIFMGQLGL